MYIIKREILDRDLDFISSIEYVMYINYSSASKRLEYLKDNKYTNSATLYEVIESDIGFSDIDDIVSYMYDNRVGKIIDGFDKHII